MLLNNPLMHEKHTLHQFDNELNRLHALLVDMTNLLLHQWELAIEAMADANLDSALQIISLSNSVQDYESAIDQEILLLLAKESPVANDLRMILSVSKIAVELKVLGDEIVGIARMIMKLNRPRSRVSSAVLLSELVTISQMIRTMLGNLAVVLLNGDSNQAHLMLRYEFDCERELHENAKRQLSLLEMDAQQIGSVLHILQILKSLESCGEHCKNIAEYSIYMIDGVDVRHTQHSQVC